MERQLFPHISVMCDASPKGKLDAPRLHQSIQVYTQHGFVATKLWMPLITMGKFVSIGTVQKLSTLLPSSATAQQKLEAATLVAESATASLACDNNKKAAKKKL